MLAFHSSLLCMFAAHDAVGCQADWWYEDVEHREVSRLITKSEAQRRVVKLVAAM